MSRSGRTLEIVAVDDLPALPFDHWTVVEARVARPRNQATYSSLPAFLLPERFTLTELQRVYEQALGVALNHTAFRRKIMDVDMPEAVAGERRGAGRRPVRLYRLRQAVPSRYNRAFAAARTRSGSG